MNKQTKRIVTGTLMVGVIGLTSSVFARPSFASNDTYAQWGTTTPSYASMNVEGSKSANSVSLTKYSALSYVTYLSYNQSNEHQSFAMNNQSNNDYRKGGNSKLHSYTTPKKGKEVKNDTKMKYDSSKSDKKQEEMSRKDESKMSDYSHKNEDEHVNASLASKHTDDSQKSEPCDESENNKESQDASRHDWKAKMSNHDNNWNQNDDEDSDEDSEELTYEKKMESFHNAQKDAKSEDHESQSDESHMHEQLSYAMNH